MATDLVKVWNKAIEALGQMESEDCISRQQAIEAIEGVDWYHVNSKGELVHGSTSDEESWYKAEDIYKTIGSLPPVTPTVSEGCDCISKHDIWKIIENKNHGKLIDVDKFTHDFSKFKEESWTTLQVITFLQNEPPVVPATEVVKNCISRQQAIDDISNIQVTTKEEQNILNACIILLEGMPSVTPSVTPTEQTIKEIMDFIGGMNMVGEISNEAYAKISAFVDDGTPTEQNEEDILKFYYVESLDEYWIGQRCGTRYYGKEIPFNEWLKGFLEKECQTERTGEWLATSNGGMTFWYACSVCHCAGDKQDKFCKNCGAKMGGDTENRGDTK